MFTRCQKTSGLCLKIWRSRKVVKRYEAEKRGAWELHLHRSASDRWRGSCKKLSALSPAWEWSFRTAKHPQRCSCSWSFLASGKREGRERKSKAGRRMVTDIKKRADFHSKSLLFSCLSVILRAVALFIFLSTSTGTKIVASDFCHRWSSSTSCLHPIAI